MANKGRSKHTAVRKKRRKRSLGTVVSLLVCLFCVSAAFFLWKAALAGPHWGSSGGDEDDFRPVVGDPPYRVAVDAGHGGSDPGARGVVEEKEMTAATSAALLGWLEADPNFHSVDLPRQLRYHRQTQRACPDRQRAVAGSAAFHPWQFRAGGLDGLRV